MKLTSKWWALLEDGVVVMAIPGDTPPSLEAFNYPFAWNRFGYLVQEIKLKPTCSHTHLHWVDQGMLCEDCGESIAAGV